MIKAIIFDWHGVLDQVKFDNLIAKLGELTETSFGQVKKEIKSLEKSFARGGAPEKFWGDLKKVLELNNKQVKEAQSHILNIFENESLWSRLPSLKKKYKLAILSDCPVEKAKKIRKSSDLTYFFCTYFSGEKKLVKSDDEFFLSLIKELKVEPAQCLFVDDRPHHIATAKRLGLQTCLFVTTEDLDRELARLTK